MPFTKRLARGDFSFSTLSARRPTIWHSIAQPPVERRPWGAFQVNHVQAGSGAAAASEARGTDLSPAVPSIGINLSGPERGAGRAVAVARAMQVDETQAF